ncbi:hypothetical protein KTH81_15155 [Lachnospiraceae bacterium ASD3451]|uniref:hypothetical protein n=1 Tax=Diplocloster agilis TaxID=2850323 RepID=UPI001DD68964|nr:hypothetical protein [Diplocloster agilis]MBU9745160.1 hypothetical protein [Diplocloster agilis]
MSEKEKEILEKIAENLPYMDDEDKVILAEKADSMAYMNRKWKRKVELETSGNVAT